MVATLNVLNANWPDDGWSSSWGLSNSPRPGGMARTYRIQGRAAHGVATVLRGGMNFTYVGTGNQSSMRWTGTTKLEFSTTLPFMLWDHFSDSPTHQVLFIEWGIFPVPDFPFFCQWASQFTIPIPASREVFEYPLPADIACGFPYTGGFANFKPEIRPLNENALAIWT